MADERTAEQADRGAAETAISQPHDQYFQPVFSNEQDSTSQLLELVARLIGGLYRAKGFEAVAHHVEYLLATLPEALRKEFEEALRRNVPGRGGEVMNYVEEVIERGRREGRREGE